MPLLPLPEGHKVCRIRTVIGRGARGASLRMARVSRQILIVTSGTGWAQDEGGANNLRHEKWAQGVGAKCGVRMSPTASSTALGGSDHLPWMPVQPLETRRHSERSIIMHRLVCSLRWAERRPPS